MAVERMTVSTQHQHMEDAHFWVAVLHLRRISCPSRGRWLSSLMALSTPSASSNSQKPKPFDLPLSGSFMGFHDLIVPHASSKERMRLSSTVAEIFPTQTVVSLAGGRPGRDTAVLGGPAKYMPAQLQRSALSSKSAALWYVLLQRCFSG